MYILHAMFPWVWTILQYIPLHMNVINDSANVPYKWIKQGLQMIKHMCIYLLINRIEKKIINMGQISFLHT